MLFGHIFRAFWPHILLLAASGLKTDIFKTVVEVFRVQGFQVLCLVSRAFVQLVSERKCVQRLSVG